VAVPNRTKCTTSLTRGQRVLRQSSLPHDWIGYGLPAREVFVPALADGSAADLN